MCAANLDATIEVEFGSWHKVVNRFYCSCCKFWFWKKDYQNLMDRKSSLMTIWICFNDSNWIHSWTWVSVASMPCTTVWIRSAAHILSKQTFYLTFSAGKYRVAEQLIRLSWVSACFHFFAKIFAWHHYIECFPRWTRLYAFSFTSLCVHLTLI